MCNRFAMCVIVTKILKIDLVQIEKVLSYKSIVNSGNVILY